MPENSAHNTRAWPPALSAHQQAHTDTLARLIREDIDRAGGSIDFARFMELALYAPGYGYYRGGAPKFGPAGDFVTAPTLTPLYARCLARQCAQILRHLGQADIIEMGAGGGELAVDLLHELDALGSLPQRYLILELSGELQQRQAQAIEQASPALRAHVQWLQTFPSEGVRGVVLANEVLDAMPVHRFHVAERRIEQLFVKWDGDRFAWTAQPASVAVLERVQGLALSPGYVSEVGLQAEAWIRSAGEHLRAGALLLIDYGFPRAEYYHPQRREGTLMCHYRHRAHTDPLILLGLQDITAHIDFTALAQAGVDVGLDVLGYTSQAAFLIANGLTEFVREPGPHRLPEHADIARQINILTSPAQMGELYKVIAFGRGTDVPLQGFVLQDRRGRL